MIRGRREQDRSRTTNLWEKKHRRTRLSAGELGRSQERAGKQTASRAKVYKVYLLGDCRRRVEVGGRVEWFIGPPFVTGLPHHTGKTLQLCASEAQPHCREFCKLPGGPVPLAET
ncbi:hypothetical protein E2C01_038378 [Portunus trituberculatus]|uniref:Uncharacterized protein n=1 Tax=Portunus trituberculatus TaxID=210409 RepID=A0A5B7FHL6_PORTR|nr:hypothetical protein [Portunus trituberculatus]